MEHFSWSIIFLFAIFGYATNLTHTHTHNSIRSFFNSLCLISLACSIVVFHEYNSIENKIFLKKIALASNHHHHHHQFDYGYITCFTLIGALTIVFFYVRIETVVVFISSSGFGFHLIIYLDTIKTSQRKNDVDHHHIKSLLWSFSILHPSLHSSNGLIIKSHTNEFHNHLINTTFIHINS